MWSQQLIRFYETLPATLPVPAGVEVLAIYQDPQVRKAVRSFYSAYYSDENRRTLVLGINPGRFGGGTTGIPFTDPERLAGRCGIEHSWPTRAELSSDFIYRMIEHLGGVRRFFGKNLLSAVCPLGFTRNGKNLNYYDEPELLQAVGPFIVETLKRQFRLGNVSDRVVLLGEGQNLRHFQAWNREHSFCKEIIHLPHPRFIMQYRRKQLPEYLDRYAEVLG